MSNLLLAIVYLVIVVPAGYVARLVRDPLARDRRADVASYWRYTSAGHAASRTPPTHHERSI